MTTPIYTYCRVALLLIGIGGAMAATLYPLIPASPPISSAIHLIIVIVAWASVIWAWRRHRLYLLAGSSTVAVRAFFNFGVAVEFIVTMVVLTGSIGQPSRRQANHRRHYLALQTAIQNHDLAGVEAALRFADADALLYTQPGWDREMKTNVVSPLEAAVATDDLSIAAVLLDAGAPACPLDGLGYDPSPRYAQMPMALAAMHGNVAMMRLLLHHGATVNDADGGSGVLWLAVRANRTESVVFLLLQGANPESFRSDVESTEGAGVRTTSWSALRLARSQGNVAIVRLLLQAGAKN